MKKLNIDIILQKFKEKHKVVYDYSLFENYVNTQQKIKIICKNHGIFEQVIKNHLRGHGCKKCGENINKKDIKKFISEANIIHNNKYEYSIVEYKNSYTKVKIICPKHGEFKQTPHYHLKGYGCKKCSGCETITNESFIKKSNGIYNNFFDYSLVKYINSYTKVKIICPKHGEFEQNPQLHLNGKGCKRCNYNKSYNNDDFIKKSNKIHNFFYNYGLTKYTKSNNKVKIICPLHGVFEQVAYIHILGKGCPYCKKSKGENKIKNFLDKNKIKYYNEKTFSGCHDNNLLRFDFYLPEHNICIEYDGEHHFNPIKKWGGLDKLLDTQRKDKIKTEYCINNSIKLYRIKYTDNINEKLNEIISSL